MSDFLKENEKIIDSYLYTNKLFLSEFPMNPTSSIFSILGKQPPELPSQPEDISVVSEEKNLTEPEKTKETLPSIEELPFLESYNNQTKQHTLLHRETGYFMITTGGLKVYLFWNASCLEYRETDEAWNEQEARYSRGDFSSIPEEVRTRFDFDPSRFDEYPKGRPRKEGMQYKRAPANNPRRFSGKWKGGYKYSKSKIDFTDELIKTREIWKDTEELVFRLLREHKIDFSNIALFFQDTESSIRERAKVRDMGETRKIVQKMQQESIEKYGPKYVEWLRTTGGKIY